MANTPKKTKCLENLKSQLQGIDGNDPYHYDFTVQDINAKPDSISSSDYPALIINESQEVIYHLNSSNYNASTGKREEMDEYGWFVLVEGILKINEYKEKKYQQFHNTEFDIIYAVGQDTQLGGNCDLIFPRRRQSYIDYDNQELYTSVIFNIKYDFNYKEGII